MLLKRNILLLLCCTSPFFTDGAFAQINLVPNPSFEDISACPNDDIVIFDRLKVDDAKVEKMIASVKSVINTPNPIGKIISS